MNPLLGLLLVASSVVAILFLVLFLRARAKLKEFKPITDLQVEQSRLQAQMQKVEARRKTLEEEAQTIQAQIENYRRELRPLEDEMGFIEHGLYAPLYTFDSSERYQQELERIRQQQKDAVKDKKAVLWHTEWTVEGSKAKGRQMQNEYTKLVLRAFNGESDALIAKVKYNNIHAIEKRMQSLFEAVNKLGKTNNCEVSYAFYKLKLDELHLVHEYQEQKQEEIEEQRRIREQMREEELARRELERAMMEAEKEETRYMKALEKARQDIGKVAGEKQAKLESEIQRLQELLAEAQANRERAKSQAEMTRSGYVYVISNVGSFGEQIYKIGMTRRLDPMDRVSELGDASVPFQFDVHAMIFTEDAPALENALHKVFDQRRVNRINLRKEFFRVSLEEIRKEAMKHRADVHFTMKAEAEEFRKTQALVAHAIEA